MKKKDLIRNLKAELSKLEETKKTYDTFETRYDLMIEDVLDYIENSMPKEIIIQKINERKFELQQEYKDFEDDIRLNTLQELYDSNELSEE